MARFIGMHIHGIQSVLVPTFIDFSHVIFQLISMENLTSAYTAYHVNTPYTDVKSIC